MQKFRKLPVEIEAVQFTGTGDSCTEVTAFLGGSHSGKQRWNSTTNTGGVILTLEGEMTFVPGDWIIRGVEGEFYPCRDDIFRQTYEAVLPEPAREFPEPPEGGPSAAEWIRTLPRP